MTLYVQSINAARDERTEKDPDPATYEKYLHAVNPPMESGFDAISDDDSDDS